MQVLPFIIAEEVVRKSLTGQEVTYLVKRDQTAKTYNLAELEGKIYREISEVREDLIANVSSAIDKICSQAHQKAAALTSALDKKKPVKTRPDKPSVNIPSDEDLKSFVLEDGTKVHVNLGDI
jgi:hypothetical protein